MNGWLNVYQNVNQANQMNNFLLWQMQNSNQMNQINQMNQKMHNCMMGGNKNNNPLDNIQMTSNMIQNNSPQMMGQGFQNFNQNLQKDDKINLCFSTIKGARIMMSFNPNETIDGVITKFLMRCNLDYLIHNMDKELTLILSGKSLKFGDFTKIKDCAYGGGAILNVLVIDTNNLIGASFI